MHFVIRVGMGTMSDNKQGLKYIWRGDRDGFSGIEIYNPDETGVNYWGPFDTFIEAKKDAISYYQCDKRDAETAIKDIRGFRKKDIGSNWGHNHD